MSNPLYDYRATYQSMPDGKLVELAEEEQSLTQEARVALWAELGRRGIPNDLTKATTSVSPTEDTGSSHEEWVLDCELDGPIPRRTYFCLEPTSRGLLIGTVFLMLGWVFFLIQLREGSGHDIAYHAPARSDISVVVVALVLAFLFLALLAAPLLFLWKLVTHCRLSKLLVTRGTPARGVIVSVRRWVKTNYKSESRHPRYDYVIAYETPDCRQIELEEEIVEWPIGHALTILYLPEAPDKAKPYNRCCYKAL